jgi:hypothetical protein
VILLTSGLQINHMPGLAPGMSVFRARIVTPAVLLDTLAVHAEWDRATTTNRNRAPPQIPLSYGIHILLPFPPQTPPPVFSSGVNNELCFTSEFQLTTLKSGKPMNKPDQFDNMIEAAAEVFGFNVELAWKPGVRANLQVLVGQAALFMAFELPDDAEPAPIFKA